MNQQGLIFNQKQQAIWWMSEMSDWISVKDNLPINGQRIIMFCDGIVVINDFYMHLFRGEGMTHWQPLPEPPK